MKLHEIGDACRRLPVAMTAAIVSAPVCYASTNAPGNLAALKINSGCRHYRPTPQAITETGSAGGLYSHVANSAADQAHATNLIRRAFPGAAAMNQANIFTW
jgi:hypothetical protein